MATIIHAYGALPTIVDKNPDGTPKEFDDNTKTLIATYTKAAVATNEKPPVFTTMADVIDWIILWSHKLYNEYAYIERRRRKAYRRVQHTFPDIKLVHDEMTDIEIEAQEVYRLYRKTRHLPDGTPGKTSKYAVRKIYTTLDQARKKHAKIIRKHIKELAPLYAEIEARWGSGKEGKERKIAYNASPIPWGMRLKIVQAVDQACKAEVEYYDINGNPRKVVPWEFVPAFRDPDTDAYEKGIVAVQLQNGSMPVSKVFTENDHGGLFRIDPLPANAFDPTLSRSQRAKLQRTTAYLRIGSIGPALRSPIWASWPVFSHRPLPVAKPGEPEPTLSWAMIVRKPYDRESIRNRHRWELHLAFNVSSPPPKQFRDTVAINLGWRELGDGDLRIATWVDSNGQSGELHLDHNKYITHSGLTEEQEVKAIGRTVRKRIQKKNDLQGHRADNLNKLRKCLAENGIAYPWKTPKLLGWLLEDLEKKGVLAPEIKELVNAWQRDDRHHQRQERGTHRRALRRRREVYRLFALDMAQTYDVVIIEKYNIKDIAEREDRRKGPSEQRVEGSPSEARAILRSTVPQHGCLILEGDSRKATQRCHLCGCEDPWDAAPDIMHTCAKCGETWDQDINNAQNMLDRQQSVLQDPQALAEAYEKQTAAKKAKYSHKHKKSQDDEDDQK